MRAYPSGGGSYTVARENLGTFPGLTAASALMIDYVLTVAVSTSAGIAALTSAAPSLYNERVELAIIAVWVIVIGNLRGIRESGKIFAIPTYLFIFSFAVMLVTAASSAMPPARRRRRRRSRSPPAPVALTLFLVLRAFSSGCSALTGMEAIANGVPAFKPPESKNAGNNHRLDGDNHRLVLHRPHAAHALPARPAGRRRSTVISQVGKTVFGSTPPYYMLQAATMLILIMASNTSFADFPRLASIMARDGFLPRHMMFRGDRLAFSAGILVLAAYWPASCSCSFKADTHRLIPLYAVGVFLSFTLSQSGMVVHWLRSQDTGRRRSMIINGVGAVGTGIVVIIAASTKFTHGAWIVLLAIPDPRDDVRADRPPLPARRPATGDSRRRLR